MNVQGENDSEELHAEIQRLRGELTRLKEARDSDRTRAQILFEVGGFGVWDWIDVNGSAEFWSPKFYALLGYEANEIPATLENFGSLLHPDDKEKTFAMMQLHFEGKAPFDIEYRLRHKTKGYRWYRGTGGVSRDENGTPQRMVGAIQDVHDKRVAQDELVNIARRNQLSLRASKIGVWDWDVVENKLVWDEQMYALYGIAAEDFSSAYEAWIQGVHPEDTEEGDRQIRRALAGYEEFDTEFRVLWPSGEIRSIRAIADTLRAEDGKPVRMVGVNWDVTEEREASRRLEQQSEELKNLNEHLEQFVSFASHDLQAPLRHVSSFIEILGESLESKLSEEEQRWMGFISEGATRMSQLISDLLAYSRAGRQNPEKEDVSLREIVDRARAMLVTGADANPLEVELDEDVILYANPTQMTQVTQNLLQNAIAYCGETEPKVHISSKLDAEFVRVHVQDFGTGIPAHLHEKIFHAFERGTQNGEGTGIGLAICKKMVEAHGGTIQVTSLEGSGATFTFSLPTRK